MGDLLTVEEKFTLRYERLELVWICRIARPGAVYDASVAAQTFDGASVLRKPGVSEHVADGDVSEA